MKKLLPKFVTPKGFTLVELLVVVSIIAVLSVIGITVFSGVQKNARDARRKADIDQISKAWEAHYSTTTPFYPTLSGGWFSSGSIPKDPKGTDYSGIGTNTDTYNVCATLEDASTYCLKNQQ